MRKSLESHLSDIHKLNEIVKFSNKANQIFFKKEKKFQNQKLIEEKAKSLSARQQKLAFLLETEDDKYKNELFSREAQPSSVKSNLLDRIERMKEMKELRRKIFVEKQNDRIFQRDDIEMRNIQRERTKLENLQYLKSQMINNQAALVQEYENNLIYEEYGKRVLQKETEKEIKKKNEKEMMTHLNKHIIELQIVFFFIIFMIF